MDNRKIGEQAEALAAAFLTKKGFKLLAQNYRCKVGEIDLVMQDKDTVVFIEVRSRSHPDFGSAAESVTPQKQHKLIKSALHYLQKQGWFDKVPCRFDIIGIAQGKIEWLKDAFAVETF